MSNDSPAGPRVVRVKRKRGNKRCRFSGGGYSTRPAFVDYKDVAALKRLINNQGKILGRKRTGTSAVWQRAVATAVKRARFMALLPYTGD
jgi:small subunit ribosomal protein S18